MEQRASLKQSESRLALLIDHAQALSAKIEDLLFRAQRMASAKKSGTASSDSMFGADMGVVRREARTFGHDVSAIPKSMGQSVREALYAEDDVSLARTVMGLGSRARKALESLHEGALRMHHHLADAQLRIEAWYLVQELEQLAESGKAIATTTNDLLIKISTPPDGEKAGG